MQRLLLLSALVLFALAVDRTGAQSSSWPTQAWPETDFSRAAVAPGEILSGGPPRDGIPSIDAPAFNPARSITDIGPSEPLIRLSLGGETRGYPLRVLTWHEIVNDTIGGIPVAVTYCPLCNSAVVFDRRVRGNATTFGTTGLLRNSDLVMYDRATYSWWQQFTGEAIVGERTGQTLKMLPSRVVSFEAFSDEDPNAPVLVPNGASLRAYGRNPYVRYDSRQAPYPFFTGEMPKGVGAMQRVVAFRQDGEPKAVALSLLARDGRVELGNIVLTYRPGVASALDAAVIAQGRDVGSVDVFRMEKGRRVPMVHDVTFAFAFHAFHPQAPILVEQPGG